VFISSGQRSAEERAAANQLKAALTAKGFSVYVATETQTIHDVNSSIIENLKRSDYYVFIDFRRERIGWRRYRGSLFTNQELAIAYVLEFEHVVVLRQKGVVLEGLASFLAANAAEFGEPGQVTALVVEAVSRRSWTPSYSRHLVPTRFRWSEAPISYAAPTGPLDGYFLYLDFENRRVDTPAYDVSLRLESINGKEAPDRSPLKAAGRQGYVQHIWPRSHGAFDMLVVNHLDFMTVSLNSELDLYGKPPVIKAPGAYSLEYSAIALGFPPLSVRFSLSLSGRALPDLPVLESAAT
jgi:hypothetical protein